MWRTTRACYALRFFESAARWFRPASRAGSESGTGKFITRSRVIVAMLETGSVEATGWTGGRFLVALTNSRQGLAGVTMVGAVPAVTSLPSRDQPGPMCAPSPRFGGRVRRALLPRLARILAGRGQAWNRLGAPHFRVALVASKRAQVARLPRREADLAAAMGSRQIDHHPQVRRAIAGCAAWHLPLLPHR